MTLILKPKDAKKAAAIIKKGGIVAFPTETVYGLGADALNAKAVEKVFRAKGRPSDNPLIIHIADRKDAHRLAAKIPKNAELLMKKFWPGPLTLILKKSKSVPRIVTAGLGSVAIRMPSNKIALALIKYAGTPIAAPSANLSGKPSSTSAEHVVSDFSGKIDAIIDGGETEIGLESTVIDLTAKIPVILRPGKITKEQVERVIGKIKLHEGKIKRAKSPGMKHRHYSPEAKVILVKGKPKEVRKEIRRLAKELKKQRKNFTIMRSPKNKSQYAKYAASLFSKFRELDKKRIEIIICEGVGEKGIGVAIMDRLERAANYNIVEV